MRNIKRVALCILCLWTFTALPAVWSRGSGGGGHGGRSSGGGHVGHSGSHTGSRTHTYHPSSHTGTSHPSSHTGIGRHTSPYHASHPTSGYRARRSVPPITCIRTSRSHNPRLVSRSPILCAPDVRRDMHGRILRSQGARAEFLRSHSLTQCPPGYHVDHKIPLWAGGRDTKENMQLLTIPQHAQKTREDYVRYGSGGFSPTPIERISLTRATLTALG